MENDSPIGCIGILAVGVVMLGFNIALRPDATEMKSAVEAYGFKDANIGDVSFLGCGSRDWYQYDFTATNSEGKRVAGVVCSSGLKQYTVRMTAQ